MGEHSIYDGTTFTLYGRRAKIVATKNQFNAYPHIYEVHAYIQPGESRLTGSLCFLRPVFFNIIPPVFGSAGRSQIMLEIVLLHAFMPAF